MANVASPLKTYCKEKLELLRLCNVTICLIATQFIILVIVCMLMSNFPLVPILICSWILNIFEWLLYPFINTGMQKILLLKCHSRINMFVCQSTACNNHRVVFHSTTHVKTVWKWRQFIVCTNCIFIYHTTLGKLLKTCIWIIALAIMFLDIINA